MGQYYQLCRQHHGKVVSITCRDGKRYSGRIVNVTRNRVFLEPIGQRRFNGFGLGFWGGYGYYGGYRPFAIPLAFITGLVLGGLFFI